MESLEYKCSLIVYEVKLSRSQHNKIEFNTAAVKTYRCCFQYFIVN